MGSSSVKTLDKKRTKLLLLLALGVLLSQEFVPDSHACGEMWSADMVWFLHMSK